MIHPLHRPKGLLRQAERGVYIKECQEKTLLRRGKDFFSPSLAFRAESTLTVDGRDGVSTYIIATLKVDIPAIYCHKTLYSRGKQIYVRAIVMMTTTDRFYYRRHLPHYQPSDATFFVTFRLAGSLPAAVIEKIRIERELTKKRIGGICNHKIQSDEWHEFNNEYFARYDGLLDRSSLVPLWLREPEIAQMVHDAILFQDKKQYDLIAHCIMPNHVHMVFDVTTVGRLTESTLKASTRLDEITKPVEGRDGVSTYIVTRILESLKKYTALRANRILRRSGPFWQHESYDHVVRDDNDVSRIVDYVLMNPVSAGLVDSCEKWPWGYLKEM
jgi:REP element-mobilizing transposase RayT